MKIVYDRAGYRRKVNQCKVSGTEFTTIAKTMICYYCEKLPCYDQLSHQTLKTTRYNKHNMNKQVAILQIKYHCLRTCKLFNNHKPHK